jgi:hypothetical protein
MKLDIDSSQGGKSTGKVSTNKEKIDGVEQTVINLSITLNKGVEYPWERFAAFGGSGYAEALCAIGLKLILTFFIK